MEAPATLLSPTAPSLARPMVRAVKEERSARVALYGAGLSVLSAIATFGPPRAGQRAAFLAGALAPLAPLLAGLVLLARPPRWAAWIGPALLFVGVPLGIAAVALSRPPLPVDGIVFGLEAAALLAFVIEASQLGAALAHSLSNASLGAVEVRARLRRRERLYRELLAIGALAFLYLLGQALVSGAASVRLAVAVAGLLAALCCRAFLIDPLERHLQHDPALGLGLARLRRHARRGRPGLAFYGAAAIALLAMALLVLRRFLGLEGGPA